MATRRYSSDTPGVPNSRKHHKPKSMYATSTSSNTGAPSPPSPSSSSSGSSPPHSKNEGLSSPSSSSPPSPHQSSPTTSSVNMLACTITPGFDCQICRKTYSAPRLLPCGHTFCQRCLESLPTPVRCPNCFMETSLPVDKLQKNSHMEQAITWYDSAFAKKEKSSPLCSVCQQPAIIFCPQCSHYFCEDCRQTQHPDVFALKTHKIMSVDAASNQPQCSKHQGRDLDLVCLACHTTVCERCGILDHQGHKIEALQDFAAKTRSKIMSNTDQLHVLVNENEQQLNRELTVEKDLLDKLAKTRSKISSLKELRVQLMAMEHAIHTLVYKASDADISDPTNETKLSEKVKWIIQSKLSFSTKLGFVSTITWTLGQPIGTGGQVIKPNQLKKTSIGFISVSCTNQISSSVNLVIQYEAHNDFLDDFGLLVGIATSPQAPNEYMYEWNQLYGLNMGSADHHHFGLFRNFKGIYNQGKIEERTNLTVSSGERVYVRVDFIGSYLEFKTHNWSEKISIPPKQIWYLHFNTKAVSFSVLNS